MTHLSAQWPLAALAATSLMISSPVWAQDTPPEDTPAKKEEEEEKKEGKEDKEDEDKGPAIVTNEKDTQFSLDALVGAKNLWSLSPDKVEAEYKKAGFRWLSATGKERGMIRPTWMWVEKEKKTSTEGNRASFSIEGKRTMLQFFGGKVEAEEVNFDFKGEALSMVTISVWNKGDSEVELNEAVSAESGRPQGGTQSAAGCPGAGTGAGREERLQGGTHALGDWRNNGAA